MSFGSDSPGGSPEGIGGDESGIGGGGIGGGGDSGFSGWGGGFASAYGGFDFGGGGFGFGDPGATSGFGDVGFGSDLNSAFDFGGSLENIGYSSYGGAPAYTSDISQALAAMSVIDQERIFRTAVEPTLDTYYGKMGEAGMSLASTVFGTIANAAVPGLGTLSKITGLTGYLASRMMDASFAQDLGEQLGIRSVNELGNVSAENMLSGANAVIRKQGGDMGAWDEIWGGITGSTAAGAATGAAQTQAQYQQQALDYLKSREATPLEISGGALQQLGGLYGLPGGVGDQQTFIDQARTSPLYGAILGGQQAGEEGIMRQAGMTGGLRSGNVQEALYDYNTQLENRALMGAYGEQLGGLQYLAGMQPGGAANIANMMTGIGGTLAGGQTEAAQAQERGTANIIGLAGSAYQAAGGLGGIVGGIKDTASAYTGAGGGLAGVGAAVASWF